MYDTIYRQDAIDAFKKELTVGESKGNYVTICSAIGYEGAKQILESLPPAQPERKTGKWIDNGQYGDNFPHHAWLCSECGEGVIEIDTPWYKFCPNCGADMRGEQE